MFTNFFFKINNFYFLFFYLNDYKELHLISDYLIFFVGHDKYTYMSIVNCIEYSNMKVTAVFRCARD